jgi:hypothetical protein
MSTLFPRLLVKENILSTKTKKDTIDSFNNFIDYVEKKSKKSKDSDKILHHITNWDNDQKKHCRKIQRPKETWTDNTTTKGSKERQYNYQKKHGLSVHVSFGSCIVCPCFLHVSFGCCIVCPCFF